MIAALVLVPVAAGLGVAAGGRRLRHPAPLSLGALAITLTVAVGAAAGEPSVSWSWGPSLGLEMAVDGFGRVMAVLVPAVAVAVAAWAASAGDAALPRLLGTMTAFVGVMELLVVAADLLTLLIAWELVAVCSWLLIAHEWRDMEKASAARHAYVTTRIGDLGLYLAAGAALAATGSLRFDDLAAAGRPGLDLVAGGVLLAATAKSAQIPFSPWLFSAMAGPTAASALLHSATMVAAGAYALIRLAPSFTTVGWFEPAVIAIGVASAVAGGLVASAHSDIKRALAGSTTAQYGLMFVAVGAGAAGAAAIHLVAHALFKALLFLGAGAALRVAGTGDLSRLRLGRRLPAVAATFVVGAAALAAVPPLGGAFSKEAVVAAATERSSWLGGLTMAVGFLSAFYAARLALLAYGPGRRGPSDRRRIGELVPLVGLAAGTVLLGGLWLPGGVDLARRATDGKLPGAGPAELAASVAFLVAGVGAAWWLDHHRRLSDGGVPAATRRMAASWFGLPGLAGRVVVQPVARAARALDTIDTRGLATLASSPARAATAASGRLARCDDRAVDAGVRAAAGAASLLSRLLDRLGELSVDGAVRAVAAATMGTARLSRVTDDRGVDGAVEGVASGVGAAGRRTRRLQTGLTHHYYLVVAVGLAAGALAAAWWR